MSCVTIKMIAAHTGKNISTIRRAMSAAGVQAERVPGAKGLRLEVRKANTFLSSYYPEAIQEKGPITLTPTPST